jgi:hypothetical protein
MLRPDMRVLELEAFVILAAYLMAGIPVAGIVVAGRMSPLYRLPGDHLCRWWSRCALLIAAAYVARSITG